MRYSTYLGGTEDDSPRGIAVAGGNAFVTGETLSSNFPTTAGAFDRTYARPVRHVRHQAEHRRLGPGLLDLPGWRRGRQRRAGVAVDAGGNAYAIGFTSSTDFPTTPGAFDTDSRTAGSTCTLTKLNPAGSALVYSTYLGGAGFDGGSGLAVDGGGNAYVAGGTGSTNFPTTAGAFDTTVRRQRRVRDEVQRQPGRRLVYSTVFGGTDSDSASGIVLDAAGNAWLTGGTTSTDFPVTADARRPTFNGAAATPSSRS